MRKDIDNGKEEEKHLREEIDALLNQLSDAKQGLLAASRLSDQLETSNQTISKLKAECKYLKKFIFSCFVGLLVFIVISTFFNFFELIVS